MDRFPYDPAAEVLPPAAWADQRAPIDVDAWYSTPGEWTQPRVVDTRGVRVGPVTAVRRYEHDHQPLGYYAAPLTKRLCGGAILGLRVAAAVFATGLVGVVCIHLATWLS